MQTNEMLKSWVQSAKGPLGSVETTPDDTMVLALNVLMAAGFGKSYALMEVQSLRRPEIQW